MIRIVTISDIEVKFKYIGIIIGMTILSCGFIESNDDDVVSDKVYVALQGLDQVGIIDLSTGEVEKIDIIYEFPECLGLGLTECVETNGCMWMPNMGHCHEAETHEPHFIALDAINGYWFVTTISSGWIGSYNLDTNELVDTIMVGNMPALMVLNEENQKLYVSRMMSMGVHTQYMTFVNEIDYDDNGMMVLSESYDIGSPAPHSIAINSDGNV